MRVRGVDLTKRRFPSRRGRKRPHLTDREEVFIIHEHRNAHEQVISARNDELRLDYFRRLQLQTDAVAIHSDRMVEMKSWDRPRRRSHYSKPEILDQEETTNELHRHMAKSPIKRPIGVTRIYGQRDEIDKLIARKASLKFRKKISVGMVRSVVAYFRSFDVS